MKLGVIARADDRGLGHQTWEVCRHLNPERVLVLTVPSSEQQGFVQHLDRYPGATVMAVDDRLPAWHLNEKRVREWLAGLDVVYTAETLYEDDIAKWAASMGVATVIHCNPEWYRHHRGGIPHPTQWWSATNWRHNHLPDTLRFVPMPSPTDRWPTLNDSTDRAVFHPAGRVAAGDRNGTDLVIEAAALMPDVKVYLSAQEGLRARSFPSNVELVPAATDYWDTYSLAPVMVLPRRYGGLCLPVIEACGAGVVPVLPDCKPNRMWPGMHVRAVRQDATMRCQGGDLAVYNTDPQALASATRAVLNDLDTYRADVAVWRDVNSWDALTPLWLDELERAADKAATPKVVVPPTPKPDAKVSVLVPYTEERVDVWRWVRARWEAHHPSWEIVDVECVGQWCKGDTVAQAAEWATADVFVVADADSFVDPATMNEAVRLVGSGEAAWVVPHHNVYRLDEKTTARLLKQEPTADPEQRNASLAQAPYKGAHGGGMVVLTREALQTVPMDPRFVGYGGEDLAWGEALETLLGPYTRLDADFVHLWHQPLNGRRKSTDTLELRRKYREAFGVPRLMRALIDGVEAGHADPLPRPARFSCENRRLRLVILGQTIQFRDGFYETDDPDMAAALRQHPRTEEVA